MKSYTKELRHNDSFSLDYFAGHIAQKHISKPIHFPRRNKPDSRSFYFWCHPLSTYAKFAEKLAFLIPRYAHVRNG